MSPLQLSTESGCGLAIAGYPRFRYDARGGGGPAEEGEPEPQPDPQPAAQPAITPDGQLGERGSGEGGQDRERQPGRDRGGEDWRPLSFAPEQLMIPTLNWRTTRLLGLPLPPGIAIAIVPERLQGHWQPDTGAVELAFRARFRFSLAGLYRAPDLLVATQLSSGEVVGRRHRASGSRLDGDGRGVLVGVARVEPSGDPLLDRFLGLPDEALAVLRCRLSRS
jgi:hypothetical protein